MASLILRRCLLGLAFALIAQIGLANAQFVDCPPTLDVGQKAGGIPEIVSDGAGRLRGSIVLRNAQESMPSATAGKCLPQLMRFYQKQEPSGTPDPDVVLPPMPGPTLRAILGDVVELTFVNQINVLDYAGSIDQAEEGKTTGCDRSSTGYPVLPSLANPIVADVMPDCFHGSSTGNLHFHGTHTNPNSSGDNVFIGVRPSPRASPAPGQPSVPLINDTTYKPQFDDLFAQCEQRLQANNRSQWPFNWTQDMPASWASYANTQKALLLAYDNGTAPFSGPPKPINQQLWPVNAAQIAANQWPQYYMGASPYCFLLPKFPGKATPALRMGQAPGTHWYHAHKHGSTALNVSNGMAGAFLIESPDYDGVLTAQYGSSLDKSMLFGWTRRQPTLVVNQLGTTPNLMRGTGSGPPAFSINGQQVPNLSMQPGEIKLWRIVNASSISGFYLTNLPAGFTWHQTAQDGVQFDNANYQSRKQRPVFVAPGNRIDLLVQAPAATGTYAVNVQAGASVAAAIGGAPAPLLNVVVAGTPVTGASIASTVPPRPPTLSFLKDITAAEVGTNNKRVLVFNSANVVVGGKPQGLTRQHTIGTQLSPYNGAKFDLPPPGGTEPLSVTIGKLDTVEEWTIYNTTTEGGGIDHPFHIHINPFQVTEVFSPNAPLVYTNGQLVLADGKPQKLFVVQATKPTTLQPGQCWLNPADKTTWAPCKATPPTQPGTTNPPVAQTNIWWDVFPIPAAAKSGTVVIPGYFKMRSRFVDYQGTYVLHCHILAHEDRGMMMSVTVGPKLAGEMHQHH